MAASYGPQTNPGLLVPTTNVWDPSQLYNVDVTSPEFKELLVRLYQNINTIAIALNLKDSGYYVETEFLTGQQFFPNPALSSTTPQTPVFRGSFRTVVDFGALPNATTKSVAHNIDFGDTYSFTRIYAASTDQVNLQALPIPYATTVPGNEIELWVDATNVNIRTASDYSAYTVTYVILEYIKQ